MYLPDFANNSHKSFPINVETLRISLIETSVHKCLKKTKKINGTNTCLWCLQNYDSLSLNSWYFCSSSAEFVLGFLFWNQSPKLFFPPWYFEDIFSWYPEGRKKKMNELSKHGEKYVENPWLFKFLLCPSLFKISSLLTPNYLNLLYERYIII